jgi:predicted lipoprotein with Yx(FWY)xxD motif
MNHGTRDLESQWASSGGPSPEGVDGSEPGDQMPGAQGARRWARLFARHASRRVAVGAILSVGLVAAACGSSTTSAVSNTANTGSKATTVPATVVGSTTNPTLGMILVNASGATLYRFAADQNGQSTCTGACAQLWPPFTVTAGSPPKGASGVVGVFATSKRADGTTQVTYNGSPLYTFSGDKSAGSTAGQGVLGMWFVANVSATPAAAPTTTAAGSNTTTTRAPSTPAITPTTPTTPTQPTPTSPAPTSPPPTAPPTTSPPPTSPPPTSPPPPPTTTPTTMGYGY